MAIENEKTDKTDMTLAIKTAIAELKAEQEAKEADKVDVKQLVKDAMAEVAKAEVVEVKRVVAPIVKENAQFECKAPGYSKHNYSNLIGYKDSEIDQAYNDGMWYKAAMLNDPIAKDYCDANGIELKALTSITDASGGYTVPEQLLNRIIVISNKYGVIRNRIFKFASKTGTMLIPKNGTDTEATFTAENIAKTESDPGFDQVEVTIKKLAIVTKVPMELIQDSVIDIISYVIDRMGWAIAKKEDTVGFYGDGTAGSGSMTGIIPAIEAVNTQPSVVNPITNDGTWASIVRADFNAVMGKLNEAGWEADDVAWYCSNGFYHNVMNRVKGDGGTAIATIEAGFKKQFMGYEVVTTSILPSTDAAQPSVGEDYCLFGSMKTVLAFADRMGKNIKSTVEGQAAIVNQVWLITEQRFGLTVHDQGDEDDGPGSMILLQS